MTITLEAIRAAGGIVHGDGNIFFRDISMLQGLAGAAPAAVSQRGEYPQLPEAAVWSVPGKDGMPTLGKGWMFSPVQQGNASLPLFTARQMWAYHDLGRQCALAAPALEAPAAPLDDSELEDLAHSANQECLSFGMSLDPFLRLAKTVRDRMLAAAPQAPAAPSVLPSGWVPCILTHDGQHPEEVAYGPQIMMDRLKKWLGRYFELLAQKVLAEPVHAEMLAALQAVALDVVHVGAGENAISDAARAKVEAVLEKIGAPWPSPEAAPAAPVDDLAQLVKQLVQALRKAAPNHVLPAKALDYLRRQDLLGSPLRAAPAAPVAVKGVAQFRKRPVTISAIQWTGKNLREVITFTDGPPETRGTHAGMAWEAYTDLVERDGLMIYTLEGKMNASVGDWIIRGVKGEHYACKPDIFAETYEPAMAAPAAPAVDAPAQVARDAGFNHGVCLALQIMASAGNAGSAEWIELLDCAGRDEIMHYAQHVETESWLLCGFAAIAAQAKEGGAA